MKSPGTMKKRPPPRRTPTAKTVTVAKAAGVVPANPREPTYDDILAIARLIESGSRFSEFRLRSGDIEVEVKRGSPEHPSPRPSPEAEAGERRAAANDGAESLAELPRGTEVIRSPMVGTFYRAPDPGSPPFVEPGSRVAHDTIVCIIEVMKLMNSVTAGVRGVVTHVFVENAQMVEHGQPLIGIKVEP